MNTDAWYVLYTKPRNEKKVVSSLEKMGITVYCPMVTEIHQWSDRKKKVTVPLINSYIFVQIASKERDLVFQVPGVLRYLFWLKKPAKVRNSEIVALKEWLQETAIDTKIESLQPGDRCEVLEGPFKGKEGVVQEVNKNRLQLILIELGMKITIQRQLETI